MRPSRSSAAEFMTRLAGLGVGGSDHAADHGDAVRFSGNLFDGGAIALDERRAFDKIAGRVAADGKFRKKDEAGAGAARAARQTG